MSSKWSDGFVVQPVDRLGMAKKLWTAQDNTFCYVKTFIVDQLHFSFSVDPCASLLSRCTKWDLTVCQW